MTDMMSEWEGAKVLEKVNETRSGETGCQMPKIDQNTRRQDI